MRVGKGFTKLEFVFLLVIVAVLAAIAIPAYQDYTISAPHPSARPDKNYAIVRTFFATDRSVDLSKDAREMFGHGRADLKYGVAEVSIPRAHRMGELESPSFLKFEFREDPEKHIVLLSAKTFSLEQFVSAVEERVDRSEKKSAFVFVHGYNTSFEDASRRTAQIAYDLGFDGAPIFYSWPSRDNEAAYTIRVPHKS